LSFHSGRLLLLLAAGALSNPLLAGLVVALLACSAPFLLPAQHGQAPPFAIIYLIIRDLSAIHEEILATRTAGIYLHADL